MGVKGKNLKSLLDEKINIHEFEEITSLDALINYSNKNDKFSIRFDRNYDAQGLPFYIYDKKVNGDDKITYFHKIIDEMTNLNCSLICSNGYKYDNHLKFNFVIEVNSNDDFILELCDKKIPLRTMYNYKTTIIKGNLFDSENYEYINMGDNHYLEEDIDNIINFVCERKYKYIEGTLYDTKVGMFHDFLILRQTK